MQSQSNLSIEKKENLLTPESVLPMYHTYLESRNSSQHTIKAYLKKVKICWETLYELGYTSLDQITVNTIEELSVYLSMREWRGELINDKA